MLNKNILKDDLKFISTLKSLATVYQEISVLKMKKARETIDHSRLFVDRLKQIFNSIYYSHELIKKKFNNKKTRNIAKLVITANSKFNGDILRNIVSVFLQEKTDTQDDIFVIGKVGKEILEAELKNAKINFFETKDSDIASIDLRPLLEELVTYREVYIYMAEFKTVLKQVPMKLNIPILYSLLNNKNKLDDNLKMSDIGVAKLYLFEPSAEEIADYLDDNIITTFVRQSVYETELSRNAARINAMSELIETAGLEIKKIKRQEQKLKRDSQNKKQLERLNGVYLWHNF